MTTAYFNIKDSCRLGLIKYLEKALSVIPEIENPEILDIGCGTGVPTLWLADKYSGSITAIDTDSQSLEWLQKKANSRNLSERFTTMNISFLDFQADSNNFDIIIAEGFLNVVGFETGFQKVIKILKRNGYFIIHDEFKDHDKKCEFIQNNNCRIVDSLYLDENIWWNDYYKKLETEIKNKDNYEILSLFKSDIKEIEYYKADPSPFRSIYYIIEKL
ncbi:MAG: class I SAM-dependent methyltransferase [Bacteroidales bacterium]|nr:class I SAM-dependent methyltransferase [Bacteroidales bacterium]